MTPDWLQYPAAALGLGGAWLVSSMSPNQRAFGFALWIVSNVAWVAWGVYSRAWGLVAMQAAFTVTSLRGLWNNRGVRP